MPQNGFTLESDDLAWVKRRVRPITEKQHAAPSACDGTDSARGIAWHCACIRCVGKRAIVDVTPTVRDKVNPDKVTRSNVAYRRAWFKRELATGGSAYAQSVAALTQFGFAHMAQHFALRNAIGPFAPSIRTDNRAATLADPTLARMTSLCARDAVLHSRFDGTASDRLPVKLAKLKENARPTFYPTRDDGTQDAYEIAHTWQTLSQATQGARHGTGDLGSRQAPDGTVSHVARSDGHAIADLVRRHETPIASLVAWINAARPSIEIRDEIFCMLHNSEKRKLAKALGLKKA